MLCTRTHSADIYERSCRCMPGGVSSPVRAFQSLGMAPLIADRGQGDTLWDVDGRAYIDYCQGWGSLILGHAHKEVVEAACAQVARGSSFGVSTAYELALAEKIRSHMPSLEKIRFVSSGTEATMSAIRLARGITHRPTIVKFSGHYHGHVDSLLVDAGSGVYGLPHATSAGIPEPFLKHTLCLPFNQTTFCKEAIERFHHQIAAIIVEPIAGNMGVVPAHAEFLQMLREVATRYSILLIFDEVITGFRVGLGGAQGLYGITPDLTCLGKIIGGGFPVAAFGGATGHMDFLAPLGPVYQAGTLSGNPAAMCAGYATLSHLEQPGFYETLEQKTRLLTDPLQEAIAKQGSAAVLHRVGSMFTLFLGPTQVSHKGDLEALQTEAFAALFSDLFEQGIYLSPSPYETHFVSVAHTEDHLIKTREAMLAFLRTQGTV